MHLTIWLLICSEVGLHILCSPVLHWLTQSRHHKRTHIPPEQRRYRCDLCNLGFNYPRELKRHVTSKRHIELACTGNESDHKGQAGELVQFYCPVAGCKSQSTPFTRRDNLKRHILSLHPEVDVNEAQMESSPSPSSNRGRQRHPVSEMGSQDVDASQSHQFPSTEGAMFGTVAEPALTCPRRHRALSESGVRCCTSAEGTRSSPATPAGQSGQPSDGGSGTGSVGRKRSTSSPPQEDRGGENLTKRQKGKQRVGYGEHVGWMCIFGAGDPEGYCDEHCRKFWPQFDTFW